MVGISGTSHSGAVYYYYSCLSRRRKENKCECKHVVKQELEDAVMQTTYKMLSSEKTVDAIAQAVYALHQKNAAENSTLKALESNRAAALKASTNLISAMEQGIITEQTKTRMKELEASIAQLDFAIEEEKQRSYTYLTAEAIADYLRNILDGTEDSIEARKLIVKHFIREVQLYNDRILIVYNFADNLPYSRSIHHSIEVEEACDNTASSISLFESSKLLLPCTPKRPV